MEKVGGSNIKTISELIQKLKGNRRRRLSEEELKDTEETVLNEMKKESIEIVTYKNKNDRGHSKRFNMLNNEFQDYNYRTNEVDEVLDEDKLRDTIKKFFINKHRDTAILELKIAESRNYLQELEKSI